MSIEAIKNVPVNIPLFSGNEKKYLNDCIDSGWISSEGSYVKAFENSMKQYIGRRYAYAVSSGSAALETAVQALDIEPESEIILPDFTIISCASAIIKAGCIPVPVDCSIDDWNMDTEKVEACITKKSKAIMAVHIYGMPCRIDKIKELADKYGLFLIEDAAEAHGLEFRGQLCGAFGDVSIFSFYPNKLITCGEGGMVLTDREEIAGRIEKIRNLFFDEERRYIHTEIGSNFRMTNMQAAIGLAQLENIEASITRKRQIGTYYYKKLKNVPGIIVQTDRMEYAENIWWVFGIVLDEHFESADRIMDELKNRGIGTRHFFYPIHRQPALKKWREKMLSKNAEFSNSDRISKNGFYIPSGLGTSKEQQDYVIVNLKELLA